MNAVKLVNLKMEISEDRNDTERSLLRKSECIKSERFTDTVNIKQELSEDIDNNTDGQITVKNIKQEISEVQKDIGNNVFKYEVELLRIDSEKHKLLNREALKKELSEEVDIVEQEIMGEEDIKQEAAQNLENLEIKGAGLTVECSLDGVKTLKCGLNTQETHTLDNVCNKFQQGFTNKSNLNKHTKRKSLECKIYQGKFPNKDIFYSHSKLNAPKIPNQCMICQEIFTDKKYLNEHIKLHTRKLFECSICHKIFIDGNKLKIHESVHKVIAKKSQKIKKISHLDKQRRHTGDTRFKCKICQRNFSELSELNGHLMIHTGEKPSECEVDKELIATINRSRQGDGRSVTPELIAITSTESEDEGDVERSVLEAVEDTEYEDIEKHELMVENDRKREEFKEFQNIVTKGLKPEENTESEAEGEFIVIIVDGDESKGTAPSNICKKREKTEDILTPGGKNIIRKLGKHKVLLEEDTSSQVKKAAKNKQKNNYTTTYKDIISDYSDNDCISTDTDDDDNSEIFTETLVNNCNMSDKNILKEEMEHRNIERTIDRTSGDESSHQRTVLRKQRCSRTGVVNKRTDTRSGKKQQCAPSNICKKREKTEDILTPDGKDIIRRLGNNKQKNPVYNYTTTYKDIISDYRDNDCIGTDTDDDDNSENFTETLINNYNMSDKNILKEEMEHRNIKRPIDRTSGEESSHQRTVLRKQRCSRTGVVNKRTDTLSGKNQQCDICQEKFTTKWALNRHLRTHTNDNSLNCKICNIKFIRKINLKKHIKTHMTDEKKQLKCDKCSVQFTHKSDLRTHLRLHTGERPFECQICHLRFNLKTNMMNHIRTHTGERPYDCHVCHMKFGNKNCLEPHLRIHTGEKPYECQTCPAKFNNRSNLIRHVKTHTGEKPFQCEVCQFRFTQKSDLNRHMSKHTGEKPFECEVCGVKFVDRSYLNRHMKLHAAGRHYRSKKKYMPLS